LKTFLCSFVEITKQLGDSISSLTLKCKTFPERVKNILLSPLLFFAKSILHSKLIPTDKFRNALKAFLIRTLQKLSSGKVQNKYLIFPVFTMEHFGQTREPPKRNPVCIRSDDSMVEAFQFIMKSFSKQMVSIKSFILIILFQ